MDVGVYCQILIPHFDLGELYVHSAGARRAEKQRSFRAQKQDQHNMCCRDTNIGMCLRSPKEANYLTEAGTSAARRTSTHERNLLALLPTRGSGVCAYYCWCSASCFRIRTGRPKHALEAWKLLNSPSPRRHWTRRTEPYKRLLRPLVSHSA